MGVIPNILFWSWEPVDGETSTYLGAVDEVVKLEYMDLPTLSEAEAIHAEWKQKLSDAHANDAREWEISVATRFTDWSGKLVEAVKQDKPTLDNVIQAIRINDIVLASISIVLASISIEAFTETGLAIKAKSPYKHTQVLGYTNGCIGYLPRAEDLRVGGWKINERYALPDLVFQSYSLPFAFKPETEQQVVEQVSNLIQQLV